jgi:transposase
MYEESLDELKALRDSGNLELDEALFGGHSKGKREWGAEGKTMVFGIYTGGKEES